MSCSAKKHEQQNRRFAEVFLVLGQNAFPISSLKIFAFHPSTLLETKECELTVQALNLVAEVQIGIDGKLRFFRLLSELENFIKVVGVLEQVKLTIENQAIDDFTVKGVMAIAVPPPKFFMRLFSIITASK